MSEKNLENIPANIEDIADVNELYSLKNPQTNFFCSIVNDGSIEQKVKIYNALNKKGESLSDHVNETLDIVDVACHGVKLVDAVTGEITEALRTVLISKNGNTYEAVSQGVVSSLQKIFAIIGFPSWEEGLKIKPVNVKTRQKYTVLTLELVI